MFHRRRAARQGPPLRGRSVRPGAPELRLRSPRRSRRAARLQGSRPGVMPMSHAPVNWLAALSSFLVGGIWYSPLLFARPWMEASGLSREELARGGTARIFGGSFALSLV